LAYPTRNNRLLEYTEYAPDGQSGYLATRHVTYIYYATGDVANITIKDAGDATYRDLRLVYWSSGPLWLAVWDQWEIDGQTGEPVNYEVLQAREFRYETGRARYLVRDWTTPQSDPSTWRPAETAHWTDYSGEQPYADYDVALDGNDDPVVTEQTRYMAGFGVHAQRPAIGTSMTYHHDDLTRNTMLTTDASGAAGATLTYTAFGEPVTAGGVGVPPANPGTRYQYAGGWGYEADLLTLEGALATMPITLQHVGARWYQPDLGRFVQRDPAGLTAGLNSYAYCENNPVVCVDPNGCWSWTAAGGGAIAGAEGAAVGGFVFFGPPGAAVGGAVGGLVGGLVGGFTEDGLTGALAGTGAGMLACVSWSLLFGAAEAMEVGQLVDPQPLPLGPHPDDLPGGNLVKPEYFPPEPEGPEPLGPLTPRWRGPYSPIKDPPFDPNWN
jgi:RHS repeat-associated protein